MFSLKVLPRILKPFPLSYFFAELCYKNYKLNYMLTSSHEVMAIFSFLRQKLLLFFMFMLCLRHKGSTHSNYFSLWKTTLKQHIMICYTSRTCMFGSIIHSSFHTKHIAISKVTSVRWTWPAHYTNCSLYHPTFYWHHYNDKKKVAWTFPKSLKIWGHFACDQPNSLSIKLLVLWKSCRLPRRQRDVGTTLHFLSAVQLT